jgi:ligand-binding sensor domain-containing protein
MLLFALFLFPCYGQSQSGQANWFISGLRDKANNLWFTTPTQGVFRYDAATSSYTNYTKANGLGSNAVTFIYEDKAGKIWIGTDDGVCKYDGKAFSKITTKEGLCHKAVGCMAEDNNGNFWFGTNGYGVCRYNPVSRVFTNFTKEQGLGSNMVQCILNDKAGNLWFGERAGGVSRYDAAANMFIKVSSKCFSDQIMDIIEDRKGNIWFVNLYDGLCRYNPTSGGYTHFTEAQGLCHNNVTGIYEDSKCNLWFGSDSGKGGNLGGGLCRYDGKTFTYFSEKDGLRNMDVWTILEDKDSNIWVGTKGSLYRFHSPSGKFVEVTYKMNAK